MRFWLCLIAVCFVGPAAAECGGASYYADFFDGRRTASGSTFRQSEATCAHRSLRFGTRVRVTWDSKSVVCTVTDRGPFGDKRIIDLSRSLARQLGMIERGVVPVCIDKVG